MKKIIFSLIFVALSTFVFSQRFDNAIGIRGGYGSGISFKHNMGATTFEAIGAFRNHYTYLGGLLEFYAPLDMGSVPGDFNWYYGFGGHIANYSVSVFGGRENAFTAGADGIIGVEYEIPDVPINVSIDIKPGLNVIGGVFLDFGSALSIRYEF